jgi:hypothetical protein
MRNFHLPLLDLEALFLLQTDQWTFLTLLHEFTYQAMAHDVLPIRDGDKIT